MNIKFEVDKKQVTCVIRLEKGAVFAKTQRIKQQADRVDELKRAKQSAYLGCMHKVMGHTCTNINDIEVVQKVHNER